MQMVLRQGLALAVTGTAIGLVGAFVVSRPMSGLLFGVAPTDPVTFVAVAAVLTTVALAACYVPARRRDARRSDPRTTVLTYALRGPVVAPSSQGVPHPFFAEP
jgi:putative ABC transport system permease protein